MKTRYTVGSDGIFRDRHGNELGRLTAVTLESAEGHQGAMGVKGFSAQERSETPQRDGGVGEDQDVAAVWTYWCDRRKPKRTDLEPSQAKLIRKALNAGYTVAELCQAIDGLLASTWHRDNRRLQLSAIFATKPGGPTLRDQIDGWIERSPSSPSPGAGMKHDDVRAGRVNALKADVMRGWHRDPDRPAPTRDALERRETAVEALKAFGITVTLGTDGKPEFA